MVFSKPSLFLFHLLQTEGNFFSCFESREHLPQNKDLITSNLRAFLQLFLKGVEMTFFEAKVFLAKRLSHANIVVQEMGSLNCKETFSLESAKFANKGSDTQEVLTKKGWSMSFWEGTVQARRTSLRMEVDRAGPVFCWVMHDLLLQFSPPRKNEKTGRISYIYHVISLIEIQCCRNTANPVQPFTKCHIQGGSFRVSGAESFKVAGENHADSSAKVMRDGWCSRNCWYLRSSVGVVYWAAHPPWKSRGCCTARQPWAVRNAHWRQDSLLSQAGQAVQSKRAPAATLCEIYRRKVQSQTSGWLLCLNSQKPSKLFLLPS